MDYEQKYKDALERAREIVNNKDASSIWKDWLKNTFPELKDEDEKIKRNIIAALKGEGYYDCDLTNECIAWLEKQGCKKSINKEYTFKSIPRLLDMIEPTDRAKSYCKKLIDSLQTEGYTTDAKVVSDCLKQMNGEKVPMATMDEQKPFDYEHANIQQKDFAPKVESNTKKSALSEEDERNLDGDKINEYLFKEHGVIAGACSSIESVKYQIAREVYLKTIDKACKRLEIDLMRLYNRVLNTFGIENQTFMLVEECAELLNAVAKMKRKRAKKEDIITELADVSIMVEQLAFFYGWDDFKNERERKLARLEDRINHHTKKGGEK